MNRRIYCTVLIATLFGGVAAFNPPAHAQDGVPLWTNRYNRSANLFAQPTAIAVDSSGNVLVTGAVGEISNARDYATVKYSGAGLPLWTNLYNGPENGDDYANAIALDSNGNVFVTGWSRDSNGVSDYATIKYSGAGVPIWTNRYVGTRNYESGATAIGVDSTGNVFVTGFSRDTSGGSDYETIKYSGAGVPLWTNIYNSPANRDASPRAIAVDSTGTCS